MSPSRSRQTGFTVTELMVVLVIIGILAAVATPSLTRDSTARKGRDFVNEVAQGLQRAHLDAMSTRVAQSALICVDRITIFREDSSTTSTLLRTVFAPASVTIWDAVSWVASTDAYREPAGHSLPTDCRKIYFNPMGNAGTAASATSLTSWSIYIRNEKLNHKHPDAGFVIAVTGLTAFVSTRNFPFSQ